MSDQHRSDFPDTSKAIVRIGEEISETFSDGDEYIGEDEDDALWVWDLSSLGDADGYVGVQYNQNLDDANDEGAGDT